MNYLIYILLMLSMLMINPPSYADEYEEVDETYEETFEQDVVIEDDEALDAYETPWGEVRYRSTFLGKEYCVRMRPADPLDSFDYGTTMVFPCD